MRTVPEWQGTTDDTVPPPRVRVRLFEAKDGRCHMCGRKISAGEYWVAEHLIALCNGGENRETNLGLTCRNCLPAKNAADAAEKSETAAIRRKHILPRSKPKSKWKRKVSGETVLR